MKRFYITLIISCIFMINNGMSCDNDIYYPMVYDSVVAITAQNANNEGKYPFLSDEPIKKEAYAIAIAYLVKDSLGQIVPLSSPMDLHSVPKLKVITCHEFDSDYQAGSDVTSLFSFYPVAMDTCIHQLVLRKAPKEGIHSFIVEAHFEDTTLFTARTTPIELK